MNALPQPLPPPDSYDQSSSMWVDEAIWGHRLYDEQLPWFVMLEFLNVFHHGAVNERLESDGGTRGDIPLERLEEVLEQIDQIGDDVQDQIQERLSRR